MLHGGCDKGIETKYRVRNPKRRDHLGDVEMDVLEIMKRFLQK
jgi:hypothetical protein